MYVFILILLQNMWGSTFLLLKSIHTSCLDVMCEHYIGHFLFVLNTAKVFLQCCWRPPQTGSRGRHHVRVNPHNTRHPPTIFIAHGVVPFFFFFPYSRHMNPQRSISVCLICFAWRKWNVIIAVACEVCCVICSTSNPPAQKKPLMLHGRAAPAMANWC